MTHLLVTNDFPPKVGGIQAYLWELWRRLDPESFVVLTARSHPDADAFDREQAAGGIRIERVPGRVLAPTPQLVHRIRETARRVGASLVVLDPVFPLGLVGPRLGLPYAVLLHGAEVAIPGRIPGGKQMVGQVLRHSVLAVSAGGYPAAEAVRTLPRGKMPPVVEVPPGVDLQRFRPLSPRAKAEARSDLGLAEDGPLVVSVSRLVPRKGMDVLIDAAVRLRSDLPACRWPSPDAAGTPTGWRAESPSIRRLSASSAGCRTMIFPASSGQRTSSSCCVATAGSASSRRASASCSAQRLEGLERISVELAFVIDSRQAGTVDEIVWQDLVPEIDDFLRFREEAVAADVEQKAFVIDRAADAADIDRVLFDDVDGFAGLRERVGCRKASRSGANHECVVRLHSSFSPSPRLAASEAANG